MAAFELESPFAPTGDQPAAIAKLTSGVQKGELQQVLLGVTGSGKTFTISNLIAQVQRPVLVLSPNKTLAAQLWAEFRAFFPKNAVEYFVSYYDYYQPEAYIARTDTYIEKDSSRNEEIDRLRNAATRSLLTRRDVIVVASISCIYGIGSPENYLGESLELRRGESWRRDILLRKLVDLQYARNDLDFGRSRFRVRGDVVDVQPAYEEVASRIEFFGDEVERIVNFDPLTGELLGDRDDLTVFPASHYVTPRDKLAQAITAIEEELEWRSGELERQGSLLEAQRLRQRTMFDLEMLRETGSCAGVENYSRHLGGRREGERPFTLMDYLPQDTLIVVDESHVAVPQIGGMYGGDRSRKIPLVQYGFRLPSALDNRPLTFAEWEATVGQVIYVSATPGPYEMEHSTQVAEQLIRPTGLLDPEIEVRPSKGQVDDLLGEIHKTVAAGDRCLVTTLTKRMAEDLTDYLREAGVKVQYLHSDVETLERVEIIRDLRLGVFDVIVGINLLREGLDLPEVSFIAILDADKEGYLRSFRSLIQTSGRAARNVHGRVVMYADRTSDAMRETLAETDRRRAVQAAHNQLHGITPASIVKAVREQEMVRAELQDSAAEFQDAVGLPPDQLLRLTKDVEKAMRTAASNLEFERAALMRDRLVVLRRMTTDMGQSAAESENRAGRPRRPTRRPARRPPA
ncbi:MAG TPA: excinuclease ABC subunit UvrB [Candidatus Dormibacteraeota bacterium]|nr:excinuclease ABC subunit UvrB [Candidatus Dormibacteraeota bacterium]